jgi:hypothetical protein
MGETDISQREILKYFEENGKGKEERELTRKMKSWSQRRDDSSRMSLG